MRNRLPLWLCLLLLALAAPVPAQGSTRLLTFASPAGAELGSIDSDGNLSLTGVILERDATMTLNGLLAAWACRGAGSNGPLLAMMPLEGAGAGNLHIPGVFHENDNPSPSHPFALVSPTGAVVASISPEGDLYLLGQLSQGEGGPRLLAVAAASSSELRLTWRGAAGATGYRIESSPDGVSGWSQLTTSPDPLPSGTTSWTEGGLTPGTTRFYRVIAAGGSGIPSNVLGGCTPSEEALETVDYAYDGWRALEERENGSQAPARQYVYGGYLDEPLQLAAGGVPYFYHQTLNYSVAGLTNGAGELVEAYEYTPYGRHVTLTDGDGDGRVGFGGTDTMVAAAASALGSPCLYTGQRFDAETGLYYYKHRYYDAQMGRFISRDPIGILGGRNLYTYVFNKALISVDPLGLCELGDKYVMKCKVHVSNYKGDPDKDKLTDDLVKLVGDVEIFGQLFDAASLLNSMSKSPAELAKELLNWTIVEGVTFDDAEGLARALVANLNQLTGDFGGWYLYTSLEYNECVGCIFSRDTYWKARRPTAWRRFEGKGGKHGHGEDLASIGWGYIYTTRADAYGDAAIACESHKKQFYKGTKYENLLF